MFIFMTEKVADVYICVGEGCKYMFIFMMEKVANVYINYEETCEFLYFRWRRL